MSHCLPFCHRNASSLASQECAQSSAKIHRWGQLQDLPKMGALALVQNGDDVLTNLGLGTAKYADLMRHLGILSCVYLTLSWFGLSYFGPSFIDTYVK